jgi:hypothetical protein
MHWIKTASRELFGLFVDDGSLALAIIIWLTLATQLLPRINASGASKGAILFAGLGVVLAESVLRRARK